MPSLKEKVTSVFGLWIDCLVQMDYSKICATISSDFYVWCMLCTKVLLLVEQANCSKHESTFSSFTQKSKFRMIVGWMDFFWRNWLCLWVACLLSIGSALVCFQIGALAGSNEWGMGCVAAENKIVLIHIGEEALICRRCTPQTFDVMFCCNKVMKWCL